MHRHAPVPGLLAAVSLLTFAVLPISAQAADAKDLWSHNCTRCHGPDGKGDTKMGRKLKIKDLTQPKVQARMTDEKMNDRMLDGLKDNEGNERMPSFREKLSDADRAELIKYVRSLGKT